MASEIIVSGIHSKTGMAPIALGMCMAYAKESLANEACFDISRRFVSSKGQLSELLEGTRSNGSVRHILLFSNYIWNTKANLAKPRYWCCPRNSNTPKRGKYWA